MLDPDHPDAPSAGPGGTKSHRKFNSQVRFYWGGEGRQYRRAKHPTKAAKMLWRLSRASSPVCLFHSNSDSGRKSQFETLSTSQTPATPKTGFLAIENEMYGYLDTMTYAALIRTRFGFPVEPQMIAPTCKPEKRAAGAFGGPGRQRVESVCFSTQGKSEHRNLSGFLAYSELLVSQNLARILMGQWFLSLLYNPQGLQGIVKRLEMPCVYLRKSEPQSHFWKCFQSNLKHPNYDIANKTHTSLQRTRQRRQNVHC